MKKKKEAPRVIYKSKKKSKIIKPKKAKTLPQISLLLFRKYTQIIKKNLFLKISQMVCIFTITMGVILCSSFIVAQTSNEIAANFADNVLRPTLGTKITIGIEAVYFNIQDHLNRIKYSIFKEPIRALAEIPPSTTPSPTIFIKHFKLDPVKPIISNPTLEKEGLWEEIPSSPSGIMAKTSFRPDKERPYIQAVIIKMDMEKLNINSVAGFKEPGGPANPGTGIIPLEIQKQKKLVAAFNGGFQGKDGNYGLIIGGKEYVSLQKGIASLVIYNNKKPEIIKYTGQKFDKDVAAIRQNAFLLIENSKIATSSRDWDMQTWGLTTTNNMHTWRSGIGVTKEGDLLYAAGPSLVPETLAKTLISAGAVNAMQLDINPFWVRFVIFNPTDAGEYTYTSLMNEMENGGYQFLHGYQRDFFYISQK